MCNYLYFVAFENFSEAQSSEQLQEEFMKRLALFVSILLVVIAFTGCSETTEIIHSDKTQIEHAVEVTGSHILFQTENVQEYLNFLDNFDETKYEIVDISTSMLTGGHRSGEFYMVTYKVIAE